MPRYSYPHTIDNGAGERLTFLRRVSGADGGERFEVENVVAPGAGPRRYRSEFALADVPAPVQRFVFPIIVAIGSLLGKHRRFHDAPEPVRR